MEINYMLNDEKQFTDFYTKNFNKLLKWLCHSYPNLIDPESHLQDTFVKFYECYYQTWDSTKSELFTYFANYLKMSTLNTIKQKQKNKAISLDVEYEVGGKVTTLKDILIDTDNSNGIDKKLDILNSIELNMEEKWIEKYNLLMMYANGCSYDQIAELKNITIQQVKNHIRTVRVYCCDEYSKLTGEKLEFKKIAPKSKLLYNKYKKEYNKKRKLLKGI